MKSLIPVHVGLVGHIDHGKTELAKRLSEKVFTAGLDKHPQSKERGITIDLGFSMFSSEQYLVTLVDAPGHADLIRSVVAGANIIDAAILTVAADEGPQIQTIEHATVLKAMGIEKLLIAITKIDLVDNERLNQVIQETRGIIERYQFSVIDYLSVSARTGSGIEKLRKELVASLDPPTRHEDGPLRIPVDHAFPVTGHGTVLTGTVLSGFLSTGDTVQIVPGGDKGKVRTIQTFGEERPSASAGDRIGVNVPALNHEKIERGNYICTPDSLETSASLLARIEINPQYRGTITARMILNATIGMSSVTTKIIPFREDGEHRIPIEEPRKRVFQAALVLKQKVPAELGNRVLLMRTDLPVTSMRIVGSGVIETLLSKVTLDRKKTRHGEISRIRKDDVLVEGLASSNQRAKSLQGRSIRSESGAKGILQDFFGTRGVMIAAFDEKVEIGERITLEDYVEEEYHFGR